MKRTDFPNVKDEDNPIVWCERCKRHHRYYTFTQQDYDRIMDQHVAKLADAIDRRIFEKVMEMTFA